MKIRTFISLVVIMSAATTILTVPLVTRAPAGPDPSITPIEQPATSTPAAPAPKPKPKIRNIAVTAAQAEWLEDLVHCESRGNPAAVNPKDLDGTPSYGLLQFKPSTFRMFARAYKIEGELMDPEAQRAIVRGMMHDDSVKWEQQFPDCVRLLGRPPLA